jgi:hypothetical protein
LLLEIKMWCLWSRKIRTANFILTLPSRHQKNEILSQNSITSETKVRRRKLRWNLSCNFRVLYVVDWFSDEGQIHSSCAVYFAVQYQ